jgi:hypothetical protein
MLTAEYNRNDHSMAAALILDMTYGIHVDSWNDPYVEIAKEAMHGLAVAGVPGRFLVVSPILSARSL